jgi:hypothetical protein
MRRTCLDFQDDLLKTWEATQHELRKRYTQVKK